jgi:subfamily B ATP-binding cassette protein MsbA
MNALVSEQNKKVSSSRLIARSTRPWRFRILSAHAAAVMLGLVAAVMGLLIGPLMQILLAPSESKILWADLLGPSWSLILASWLPSGEGIGSAQLIAILPVALLGAAFLKSVLTFWQWYTWEWIGERVAFGWRYDLAKSFVFADPVARDAGKISKAEQDLGALMSQDIKTCRDYVVHFFGGLPREGLQTLFMGISLFMLSPRLFFIFILCIAPVGGLLNRLGKKMRRRASRALENNSFLGEWIQQRLLGLETIKHFKTEGFESKKMRTASARLFEEFLRAARLKARTSPIIEWFGICAICAALYICFRDIASGAISGAVAMSFFSSLALFAQSAAKLGRYFNSNREGLAAADRIFSALETLKSQELQKIGQVKITYNCPTNAIRLENVSLSFGVTKAVQNFSQVFEGGKVYCLVGASGAGKSSLFNIMLGLCKPDSGKVDFLIQVESRGERILTAYLPQAIPEIPCELGEGVAYPNLKFDESKAQTALREVGFSLAADRLTNGLATLIGPSGLRLSGGQAQRLQLARIAYQGAPFVFIDEGTSALDPEMEQMVLAQIRKWAGDGAVVVMIAHRHAAVDAADEVLVLEQGRLVLAGKTAEVVTKPAFESVFR